MEKLKLEIIKKVLMLDTKAELHNVRECLSNAISRECDLEAQQEQEFKQWKEERANGTR
jgi:hypothetical protein